MRSVRRAMPTRSLYEARRAGRSFVLLVASLGLVAFVAQGGSAGDAEPGEAAA